MSSPEDLEQRHMLVPCGIAGVDCPPEIGSPPCGITVRQIQGIGDLSVSCHVNLCQLEQRQRVELGQVPDPKTELDSLQLMLARAKSRFEHPTRNSEQIDSEDGRVTTALAAFVDGEDWKSFNQYGHGVGDDAAKRMAGLLRRLVRPTDFLGRWGERSDEFVILMMGMDLKGGDSITDRLEDKLAEGVPFKLPDGKIVPVRAKVGTAYMHNVRSYRHLEWTIHAADATVMTWKHSDRTGEPKRIYLDGKKRVPRQVPKLLKEKKKEKSDA